MDKCTCKSGLSREERSELVDLWNIKKPNRAQKKRTRQLEGKMNLAPYCPVHGAIR